MPFKVISLLSPTIEYCRQQQSECRAKLEANGWDEFTALGLSDWLHEEMILATELSGNSGELA